MEEAEVVEEEVMEAAVVVEEATVVVVAAEAVAEGSAVGAVTTEEEVATMTTVQEEAEGREGGQEEEAVVVALATAHVPHKVVEAEDTVTLVAVVVGMEEAVAAAVTLAAMATEIIEFCIYRIKHAFTKPNPKVCCTVSRSPLRISSIIKLRKANENFYVQFFVSGFAQFDSISPATRTRKINGKFKL